MITSGLQSVKTALLFTFTMVITISTFYEMLEWLAVIVLHPELGSAFLGTQGDVWDAHKDTLAATLGALVNIFFYENYTKLLFSKKYQ